MFSPVGKIVSEMILGLTQEPTEMSISPACCILHAIQDSRYNRSL